MAEGERRREHREPLPIGIYVIVDGVRHPGTLRDLSMSGAGFSDPVLAVRLNLHQGQKVVLEIPPDSPGPPPLRLPGEVAHVSSGLRPRLGIRFEPLEPETLRRLNERMGRKPAPGPSERPSDLQPASPRASVDPELEEKRAAAEAREFRFVLIEPAKRERENTTIIWAVVIGLIVIGAFFGLIWGLSNLEL